MPSADSDVEATEPDVAEEAVDEGRSALLDALTAELGDALVASHLIPGRDLWIRVSTESWTDTADYLRNRQRFRYLDFLSAIDWLPSPFGRSLGAAVDGDNPGYSFGDAAAASADQADGDDSGDSEDPGEPGEEAEDASVVGGTGAESHGGGETRFQVFARVHSLATNLGVTVKTDVGDDLTVGTWTDTYAGASWHEREASEMFGITFAGHPDLRNIYLPTDFEGHPLRKDFPLLSRLIKPWPGIVDVEPMPEVEDEGGAADSPATSNPEAG